MFIAHLPASYLLTDFLLARTGGPDVDRRPLLAVGLTAGVLPDFDLLYFHLIDHRQTLHHDYLVHLPLFWAALLAPLLLAAWWRGWRRLGLLAVIVFANLQLHLLLDTVVGRIKWLWPFDDHAYYLFTVPARYDYWVWNFVLHWSFALELLLVGAAARLLLVQSQRSPAEPMRS